MASILWPNGTTTPPKFSWQGHFGWRNADLPYASSYHRGLDMVDIGIVCSIADGEVMHVGRHAGWAAGGIMVVIQHAGFFTRSLHLASTSVAVGQRVTAGTSIGVEGATNAGTIGMARHLHLEVTPGTFHWANTGQIDPRAFLEERVGQTTGSGGSPTKGHADMEAYVAAPNGTVAHLRTGGKIDFKDPAHYRRHRNAIKKLRRQKATDLMLPPTLKKVPKVSWTEFETIADAVGAPRG